MPPEGFTYGLARLYIPEPDGFVETAGSDGLIVGAECDRKDKSFMLTEDCTWLVRVAGPEPDGRVGAAGGESCSVRAEGHRRNEPKGISPLIRT